MAKKGTWLMATNHPSAVLRDASKKKIFWQDFKTIREKYDYLSQEADEAKLE